MHRLQGESNTRRELRRPQGDGTRRILARFTSIGTRGALKAHRLAETPEGYSSAPADVSIELRLMPLIEAMRPLRPRTMIIGLTTAGRPLLFDLESPVVHHILIEGGENGRASELLRTLAYSLALTTVPAQVQLFPVDMSGSELVALEGLPHTARGLVADREGLDSLLESLESDITRRQNSGARGPHLVVVGYGLQVLLERNLEAQLNRIIRIGEAGGPFGIHLLMAGPDGVTNSLRVSSALHKFALVSPRPNVDQRRLKSAVVAAGDQKATFVAATLTLHDLDRAFHQIALTGRLDQRASGLHVWPALSIGAA